MKSAILESIKCLEEYRHESCTIFSGFFRSLLKAVSMNFSRRQDKTHRARVVSEVVIREANSDWLVNEENVGVAVPRIWVVLRGGGASMVHGPKVPSS